MKEDVPVASRRAPIGADGNLVKATAWAFAIALILLVTIVMPAEYGIDWTGAGRWFGLTAMGEGKVAATRSGNAATSSTIAASTAASTRPGEPFATVAARAFRSDNLEVALAPKSDVEYKALLDEGESMVFDWDAGGSQVEFDFHGEPKPGPRGAFLSFQKGTATKSAGSLRAPFTGTHGWYWKNSTTKPVVIKLKVSGFYTEIMRQ
jgi:hypothetical protein